MQPHIVLSPSGNMGMTVSNTVAVSFPTIATDVVGGIIVIETADVRMRFDGTDPDTSNGVLNVAGNGTNYLPGNSAGTTATGGQYL